MMLRTLTVFLAVVLGAASAIAEADEQSPTDLQIIQEFAEDFGSDPFLTKEMTFGIRVAGTMYTVSAKPASGGAPAVVAARSGAPEEPTFYYTVESSDYLRAVYRSDFNALTLMAKAFSTDVTPMDIETQGGVEPADDFSEKILPLSFHFWTRGDPEIVPFGPEMTQTTHGSNFGIFYYQPGFRSGWFDIRPGDHVNEDERSRTNPFPSMMIMIEGEVTALIGDKKVTFKEGTMMFVPPGVSHQFINEGDKPAFGFLFMFGEGA